MPTPPKIFLKADNGTGKTHGSDGNWEAPRLSEALFKAPAGATDDYRTKLEKSVNLPKDKGGRAPVTLQEQDANTFNTELKELFGHILERLKGSLDEAWMSTYGYNPTSDDFKKLVVKARQAGKDVSDSSIIGKENADLVEAARFYDSGEERWARAFTEMVVGNMYHTPNQVYGGKDRDWYDLFPDAYSITMTCQILSTYCCLSRGFHLGGNWSNGLSCSKGSAEADGAMVKLASDRVKPVMGKEGMKNQLLAKGAIKTDTPEAEVNKKVEDALAKPDAQLYAPTFADVKRMVQLGANAGSIVIFNEHGSGSIDQTPIKPKTGGVIHCASVLRVAGQRIQFVDTGVVFGSGESPTAEAGTVDHRFSTGYITHSESLVALGIIDKAKDADEKTLAVWATNMANSKPLGFTRLVVLAADRKQVLFVSKLVYMRWPVSKLIWSLRAGGASATAPYTGLTLMWLVWAPKGVAASTLKDAVTGAKPPAPSAVVTGGLTLTQVIMAKGSDVTLARNHLNSSWDHAELPTAARGFRLASGEPLIDVPPGVQGSSNPAGWCERPANFNKRYTCTMNPSDTGTINEAPMSHELVDP